MTASLGEQAVLGVEALVRQIRTATGWRTEAGASVLVSPVYADLTDDTDTESLVYVSAEQLGDGTNGIQGNMRDYPVALTINVDTHTRIEQGRESQQVERIKADHRRALLPPSGILTLDGARVGSIAYLNNTLITDLIGSGVIGLRSQCLVKFRETVNHS